MEILLLLFILSGLLKGYLLFLGITFPVDLTVLTLLLIFFKFGYEILLKKRTLIFPRYFINSILLFALFYLWILLTLFFTPSKNYSFQKAGYFGINFIAFALPLLLGDLKVKKFIKGFILLSIFCGLAYLPFQFLYQLGEMAGTSTDKLDSVGGMYLDIGEFLGLSLVFCVTSDRLWKSNLIHFIVSTTCLVVLALIGARGPLIFALLIALLYFILKIRNTLKYVFSQSFFVKIIIGCALFIVIYLKNTEYFEVLFERTLSRLMVLGENDSSNSSAITRIEFLESSYFHIFKNPFVFIFGNGIGSFGILTLNEDIRAYPHNIILEVLFELGLIGLLIFCIWIIFSIKFVRKKSEYVSVLVLIYLVMNLLKSSSLIDIRLSFIVFSLYVLGASRIEE